MTPHMVLSGVLSKSVPTTPFGGVEVVVGVDVALVDVEDGLVDEEGGRVVVGLVVVGAAVVDAVPGKHCE